MTEETKPDGIDAPPLADTADPGHAERIAELRGRAEAIVNRDSPVPGSKADKADDDRVRAMFDTREDFPRCDDRSATGGWATSETRCRLESGHEGEHADGRLHWGPTPSTHTIPTPRCMARERIGSIVVACALGKGHAGPCEWPDAAEAAHTALEEALRARLAAHRPQILPPIEHAVRVRFVALPSVPAQSETVFGSITVSRPGGFALVVDRFRHLVHLEGERELWDGFGAKIGAAHVLLYPGTLDTDDLMDI